MIIHNNPTQQEIKYDYIKILEALRMLYKRRMQNLLSKAAEYLLRGNVDETLRIIARASEQVEEI